MSAYLTVRRGLVLLALFAASCAAFLLIRSNVAHSQQSPPAAASHYSVFQRSAQASDTLPANSSIQATLVRRIDNGSPAATREWAALSGDQWCVVVEDGGSACAPISQMTDPRGQVLVYGFGSGPGVPAGSDAPPPATQELVGLAPDGVRAMTIALSDGTHHEVAVANNGFQLATGGASPRGFHWTTADGATHDLGVGR